MLQQQVGRGEADLSAMLSHPASPVTEDKKIRLKRVITKCLNPDIEVHDL